MVDRLGIAKDPSQVGYYAGMHIRTVTESRVMKAVPLLGVIESVFGFTQCMTVLSWGRLSEYVLSRRQCTGLGYSESSPRLAVNGDADPSY